MLIVTLLRQIEVAVANGMYRGGNSPTPSLLSAYVADGTSSPPRGRQQGRQLGDLEGLLQRLSWCAARQAVARVTATEIVVLQELVKVITYIPAGEGWLYLEMILDLSSNGAHKHSQLNPSVY